jgi:hypothetical protein
MITDYARIRSATLIDIFHHTVKAYRSYLVQYHGIGLVTLFVAGLLVLPIVHQFRFDGLVLLAVVLLLFCSAFAVATRLAAYRLANPPLTSVLLLHPKAIGGSLAFGFFLVVLAVCGGIIFACIILLATIIDMFFGAPNAFAIPVGLAVTQPRPPSTLFLIMTSASSIAATLSMRVALFLPHIATNPTTASVAFDDARWLCACHPGETALIWVATLVVWMCGLSSAGMLLFSQFWRMTPWVLVILVLSVSVGIPTSVLFTTLYFSYRKR